MRRAVIVICLALVACDREPPTADFDDGDADTPVVIADGAKTTDPPTPAPTAPPESTAKEGPSDTGTGDGILPNGMKEASYTREYVQGKIADLRSGDDKTAGMALMGLPSAQHLDLIVPALVEVFQDESASVQLRGTAIMMVCGIGPRAKDAVPALVAALDDKSLIPHVWHSMPQIGAAAAPAVPKLISILETHDDYLMRESAARGLEKFGPMAAEALEPLRKALTSDEHERVRTAAAWGLGGLGAAAAPAIADLEAAGAEGGGRHKFAINNAIKRIKDAQKE